MTIEVTTFRDKRNQAVAASRKLLDAAGERLAKGENVENQGFTPEERQQFERADAEIESYNKIINEHEKQQLRERWSSESQGVVTRNMPGTETETTTTTDKKSEARNASEKYQREFREYLKGAGQGAEMRALQADSDVAGGFTVPSQQFANQLIQAVHDQVFVLGLATNYTVTRAESLGAPALNTQMSNAKWGTELSVNVGGADSSLQFSKRELRPHPIVNEILVSKKLIRTSAIDVEGIVRDQMAYHFAIPLEQGFLQGTGQNQPLGVFTNFGDNVTGVTTGRDFISAASSANITSSGGDDLLEVKFALKGNYWPRAAWIINRLHFKQIRQMKDANNQYLWSPGGFGVGVSNGQPDRLLDFPIYMSEYAPTSTASGSSTRTTAQDGSTGALSGYVAICGDFSKYWTATALDLTVQVLTELKAETNQNAYLGRAEIDGMPVLAEAFSRYKLKGY